MDSITQERVFQDDIIRQMQANGWLLGSPDGYNRETALYEQDVLAFVQTTQPKEWEKFCAVFPQDSERHFIDSLHAQRKRPIPMPSTRNCAPMAPWVCCATA